MWRWRAQDAESRGTSQPRFGDARLGLASGHTYSEMPHAWRVTFNGCGVRKGSARRRSLRAGTRLRDFAQTTIGGPAHHGATPLRAWSRLSERRQSRGWCRNMWLIS